MNKKSRYLPIIGITMGDPSGVGPEVTVRLLSTGRLQTICRPVVIGSPHILHLAAKNFAPHLKVKSIDSPANGDFEGKTINIMEIQYSGNQNVHLGKLSAEAGKMAFLSIKKAIELAGLKVIDAIVTNPIHKEAIHLAGYQFAGHTEILAHFTQSKNVTMMLVHQNIRVVHVSTHVPLREACNLVKKNRVLRVIQLLHEGCQIFGVKEPVIGVAGLNPHASDGGLFGNEEKEEIEPAILKAQKMGINAVGPISPDALFAQMKNGLHDGYVAMYHDQGHIPFKLLTFSWDSKTKKMVEMHGVNVTLGLPIIRTSVDHGTAFDIAWKGVASIAPLFEAVEVATQMAINKTVK